MRFLTIFAFVVSLAHAAPERWDGVITYGSLKIPFSMQLEFEGGSVSGVFTSGETPVQSSGGTISGDTVRMQFASLGTVLEAVQNGGSMKGTYVTQQQKRLPIELNRFCTCGFVGEAGPDISGVWKIEQGGELLIERKGEDTFATIRLAGDDRQFGKLSGRFDSISFSLSHFTGTNAALLDVEPRKDGKLALTLQIPGEVARKLVAAAAGK